jgi:hypothetical protein
MRPQLSKASAAAAAAAAMMMCGGASEVGFQRKIIEPKISLVLNPASA